MPSSNSKQNTKQIREDRLAARLRDNLRRRKKAQIISIDKNNIEKEANHDR